MLSIETIENAAVIEQAEENIWAEMVDTATSTRANNFGAAPAYLREEFLDVVTKIENEYKEKYFSNEPKAKTKSGKWKQSFLYKNKITGEEERIHLMPKAAAWNNAKSICARALGNAIEFTRDSKVRGSSDISKELQQNAKRNDMLRAVKKLYREVAKYKEDPSSVSTEDLSETTVLVHELDKILKPSF